LKNTPFSVLHVEAGRSFGGSTAALESYLLHGDTKNIVRNVLFHYRVPGTEEIERRSNRFICLERRPEREAVGLEGEGASGGRGVEAGRQESSAGWGGELRRVAGTVLGRIPGLKRAAAAARGVLSVACVELPLAVRVAREARACGCDLIHSNNTPTIQRSTLIAAALTRKPSVTHVRTSVTLGRIDRCLTNRCRLVIAQSSSVADDLRRQGVTARIVECFDGVPVPGEPYPVSGEVKGELLGSPSDSVIGAVGRLVERKGFKHLIEAMPEILREWDRVTLVIVGDGPLEGSLRGLAASLGIGGRVRFLGFRRDLRYVMQAFDVFVLPSLREGLPIVLLAAMAEGRPVVASSVDGIPSFVHHEKTGLLVPPGDAGALAAAVLRLLGDRALADRLAKAGRALVAREASVKASAARVDGHLREALSAG